MEPITTASRISFISRNLIKKHKREFCIGEKTMRKQLNNYIGLNINWSIPGLGVVKTSFPQHSSLERPNSLNLSFSFSIVCYIYS